MSVCHAETIIHVTLSPECMCLYKYVSLSVSFTVCIHALIIMVSVLYKLNFLCCYLPYLDAAFTQYMPLFYQAAVSSSNLIFAT